MNTLNAQSIVVNVYDDFQAKLNAMPGFTDGRYLDGVWLFSFEHTPLIVISFVEVYELAVKYPEWYKKLGVDVIDLAKQAWLDSVSLISPNKWKQRLSGIVLFWTALAEQGFSRLTIDNLSEVLQFLLTHSWRDAKHFRLSGVQSYVNFLAMISLLKWRRTFNGSNKEIIDCTITESKINKTVSKLLPSLSNGFLTLADWKAGGSHNHLTLDFGQYYIEHCMNFFAENIAIATANASTVRRIPDLAHRYSISETKAFRLVTKILEGKSLEKIRSETWKLGFGWDKNFDKLSLFYHSCVSTFESVYKEEKFKTFILEDSTIERVLASVGAECSDSNIDRLRMILWQWLKSNKTYYDSELIENFSPPIHLQSLELEIKALESTHSTASFSIPDSNFYESLGLETPSHASDSWRIYNRQIVQKVEQAGLTLIVALTGWRRTEYGFPLKALCITSNDDILDRYAFPKRYHIDWYVKKTHGEEVVEREITFDIALLIERLAHLISARDPRPCLYRTRKSDRHDSGFVVKSSVVGLWKHFVKNYKGFNEIEDLFNWQELAHAEGDLSAVQLKEKSRLLLIRSEDEWNRQSFDINLYECWRRAREELPLLDFVFLNAGSDKKNGWLIQYRNGTLPTEWRELIDLHLPAEIRDWIMSLTDTEASVSATVREVTHYLTADCLYPTPHAFRHMFAEAIYRRYDGDVGWMIRSCFKHITRVMWQAYIRDKSNRFSLDVAKLNIRSSIVSNYLKKRGNGYAGTVHKWLRRLLRNSSVMTIEEQTEFANRISTVEIVDVKANPWGYCLLKKRSKSKAQCATHGEPQRHNASPSLCLNCTHNLVQSGNVDWLLLHLQNHVEALGNDLVPELFKSSSYKLVKSATKQILNLDPTHESLHELQSALSNYLRV